MTSLVGKWKLGEGSDIMPGLELLPGGPLILKLLGEVPAEFYKIEKKKTLEVEELLLSYVAKNASINKVFQVGTLNFEQISGNDISLCIIQNVDDNFREFTIFRMGPKAGQNSREVYKLEPNNNRIKLTVEISTPEGPRLSLIKYLTRFEEPIGNSEVVFKNSPHTLGWKLFEFWPSTMLSDTKVTIVQALKVKTQAPANNENTKVVEVVWSRKAGAAADEEFKVDLSCISRHFGYHLSDGEEVVEFVIRVTVGDMTWFVTHRYREFDAIRKFILGQNPHVASFQDADSKFPGKVVGLGFRPNAMEQRVEGLVQFLSFYLENSRYCRQNSVDALCSFLKIPENLSDAAKIRAGKMVAPTPASAATTTTSTTSGSAHVEVKQQTAAQQQQHESRPAAPVRAATAGAAVAAAHAPAAAAPTAAAPTAAKAPTAAPAPPAPAAAAPLNRASTAPPAPVPSAQSTVASAVQQTVVASSGRSQQVAKENLFAAMEHGLSIIKHGRQGNPKTRKLHCDAGVTKLYWQSDGGKDILLSEVTDIVTGSDVDEKATSPAALAAHKAAVAAAGAAAAARPGQMNRRMSSRRSIMGGQVAWDENTVYYGTENLRRTCKEEHMHLCISLILPDRTLDLQCHTQADFDLLLHNLRILVPHRK